MLESVFGCRVNANVYLTPNGFYQAFESHFDWMDGIIIQVIGCKVWSVDRDSSSIYPIPDTVFKVPEYQKGEEIEVPLHTLLLISSFPLLTIPNALLPQHLLHFLSSFLPP